MSRADIGLTNRSRTANETNNHRPRLVCPNTKKRGSLKECARSEPYEIGTFMKTSSISQSVTRCFSQFLPMLPSSQSHPSHSDGSIFIAPHVYRSGIRPSSSAGVLLRSGSGGRRFSRRRNVYKLAQHCRCCLESTLRARGVTFPREHTTPRGRGRSGQRSSSDA